MIGGPEAGLMAVGFTAFVELIGSRVLDYLRLRRPPQQERRALCLLVLAAEAVEERLAAGESIRDDGFFGGSGASAADEIVSAVLEAAETSFEERKLALLAELLASISLDETISEAMAQQAVALTRQLRYRQLVLLALLAEPGRGNRPGTLEPPRDQPLSAPLVSLQADLQDILARELALSTRFHPPQGQPRELGELLVRLLRLDQVPEHDKEELVLSLYR
jgi:hypothetical protein